MYLKSFSIENYRSIIETQNIVIDRKLTTLIGKNNEGKTNVLRALALAFFTIKRLGSRNTLARILTPHRLRNYEIYEYDWGKDFPIKKQKKCPNIDTVFEICLELNENDKKEISSKINSITKSENLKVIIHLNSNGGSSNIELTDFDCKSLNSSIEKDLYNIISSQIQYQHIPAIRTDSFAYEIANSIVALELAQLTEQKRKKLERAQKQIDKLQQPILNKIEKNLETTLKEFVPDIRTVSLQENKDRNIYSRRFLSGENSEFIIKIDDGSDTDLSQKGDGIKSLVSLGMMRQKGKDSIAKGLILAIEEPESHLHPDAIHQINRVISDISEKNQIIVTSHSPLFVNRDNISSNIIVNKNKVTPAKNIQKIRNELGVIASDNLISSDFVIAVEGETDKKILKKILSERSNLLKKLMLTGRLNFEVMKGVFALDYTLNKLNNMVCKYFCVLDSDQVAKSKIREAVNKNLIKNESKEVSFYTLAGLKEAELEDLIEPQFYINIINTTYGVDLSSSKNFKSMNGKWSDRIKRAFIEQGKSEPTKATIEHMKILIADMVGEKGYETLLKNRTHSLDHIIKQLEEFFTIRDLNASN